MTIVISYKGNIIKNSSKIGKNKLNPRGNVIFRKSKKMKKWIAKQQERAKNLRDIAIKKADLDTNLLLYGFQPIQFITEDEATERLSKAEKDYNIAYNIYKSSLQDREAEFEESLPTPPIPPGHVQVHTRNATGGICSYSGGRHLVQLSVHGSIAIAFCPITFELLKVDLNKMICIPL